MFRRDDGSPVHPDSFSQAFEALVRSSGLPRMPGMQAEAAALIARLVGGER
ncbi:MAG: hypothetical protein M3137_15570 [Actinomycetota bacterium]|nr:hypothetical protein [Actinomycetota bacterium]